MSLTVDGSSPTAAIGSGATTVTGAFTPPDNTLCVAYCQGDANNGSNDEDQTVTDSTSTTWTKKVLRNGNGGACVTVHYRRIVGTSPGSITATLTDNKGSVAKRIFVRVYIDLATGIAPDIGATAVSGTSSVSLTTTVNNSWVWSTALTANATLTAGSGCTQQDEFGGFDSGDAVQTESQTSLTTTAGTNVTNGLSGTSTVPHNVAVEIIPGSSSTAPALPPPAPRRRPTVARPARARVAKAAPEQQMAPAEIDQPRRLRNMTARRSRQTTPVRAQVNPPFPIDEAVQPRRLRGLLSRRARVWQVPLVPPVVTPPPWLPAARRDTQRLPQLRRGGRTLQPPWPQATPPANPDLPLELIRRVLRLLVPFRRPRANPPAPVMLVPPAPHRRPVVLPARRFRLQQPVHTPHPPAIRRPARRPPAILRRGHAAPPVAVPIAPTPPPLAPALIRPRRAWPPLRRRRMPLYVVASATCDCTTHRPNTGTTTRPGSGITARPFTGVTTRPCSC